MGHTRPYPCQAHPALHRKEYPMSPLTDPPAPTHRHPARPRLGKLTAALPKRLTLARSRNMPTPTSSSSSVRRSRPPRSGIHPPARQKRELEPAMRTETWDTAAAICDDQRLWNELVSLRFLGRPPGALIRGRRRRENSPGDRPGRHRRPCRRTVHWPAPTSPSNADRRPPENTLDNEYRRLTTSSCYHRRFALQPLIPAQTTDFDEIIAERHGKASTVVTSNCDASEWVALMNDPLLAESRSTG